MKTTTRVLAALALAFVGICSLQATPIESIQTPYTISKVKPAQRDGNPCIVASSYEGTLLCYTYEGELLWENKLSGYFNQDIYCADIDGDNSDEIFAASSNGSLYCIDKAGNVAWSFSPNEAPMNAVTVIHHQAQPYVVCGGYDTNIYYLDNKGNLLETIPSATYSKEAGFGIGGPAHPLHIANFLRTAKRANGDEVLVLHGVINSMSAKGGIYLFEPLAKTPYAYCSPDAKTVIGDVEIDNSDPKRGDRILLGSSKDTRSGYVIEVDLDGNVVAQQTINDMAPSEGNKFGYRVVQSEVMQVAGKPQHVVLFGSCIILPQDIYTTAQSEVIATKYAYNDLAKDATHTKLLLASEQGGGNCIHIVDLNDRGWEKAYKNLSPQGNVAAILANSDYMRKALEAFELPTWESLDSRPKVYFMSESPNRDPNTSKYSRNIHKNYPSPIFLNGGNSGGSEDPTTWQRDTMSNDFYRNRRDQRQRYSNTQDNVLKNVAEAYKGDSKGMAMWGGHGNDPFYYSPDTQHKILALTGEEQQTVLIFPEMEARGKDVEWLMDLFLYPLAQQARAYNSKLYIRSKHLFWLGNIYEPHWSKLVSGAYADVFVPSMEETTDKSMELSLMGRLGMWVSGAVDSWGTRCARDNPSYNRLRQFSHQNLPNGFLRNMVYHISFGAQYIDNFKVDQAYTSLLWEMIGKGLLYVPKREEIVSFNPVRLSILEPDQDWLDEGNLAKWVCHYDQEREENNPWVMGHLSGSWPAAPVTEWDFSRYAAGATERRLNFISSFNKGHVLITPPTDATAPRGDIEQHMHPIYAGKTKEFFTDGRNYYKDAARTEVYSPKEHYTTVEAAIAEGAKLLPLTVKGDVGWVVAQAAPKHLRVTIIDGGYINPSDKVATLVIGTAKVKSITNLATGEQLPIQAGKCQVEIPCGLFAFLDVELLEELK